ncbi:MAG: caspase family protein [Saprospiraceae bacterium]|nr:caspase family protein [Saprospiraceae bacterium]
MNFHISRHIFYNLIFCFVSLLFASSAKISAQPYKLLVTPNSMIIPSMDISPDGDKLAVSWNSTHLELWDLPSGKLLKSWKAQEKQIGLVAFQPDGKNLVTVPKFSSKSSDSLTFWSLIDFKPTIKLGMDSIGPVPNSLFFSPDQRYLIHCTSFGMNNVIDWDLTTKKKVPLQTPFGRNDCLCALIEGKGFRVAGSRVSFDMDYTNGEAIEQYPDVKLSMIGRMNSQCISSNGKYYASPERIDGMASNDKTTWIGIKEVVTGKTIKKLPSNTSESPSLTFSPDGNLLAVGDLNGETSVWDIALEKILYSVKHPLAGNIVGIRFSSDQKTLITLGGNKLINVWTPDDNTPALSLYAFGGGYATLASNGKYSADAKGLKLLEKKSGTDYTPLTNFDNNLKPELLDIKSLRKTFADLNKHPDAPYIEWLSTLQPNTNEPFATIKATVKGKIELSGIKTLLNNIEVESKGILNGGQFEISLPLKKGMNTIYLEFSNEFGLTRSRNLTIEYSPDLAVKYQALLFAVEDYASGKIPNSIDGASALAKILTENYGFEVTLIKNPSAFEVKSLLRKYRKKIYGTNDHLLVYFTGHGFLSSKDSTGYIVLKDGNTTDDVEPTDSTIISHTIIGEELLASKCNHVLLILDACHSSYFGDAKFLSRPERHPGKERTYEEYVSDLLRNTPGYFYITAGFGRVSSGDSSEKASPFTKLLLDNLKNDSFQEDGIVLLDEIFGGMQKSKINPSPRLGFFGNKCNLDAEFFFTVKTLGK